MNTDVNDMNLNPESNGEAPAPIPTATPAPTPKICPEWQKCVDALTDGHLQRLAEWRGYQVGSCKKIKERGLIGLWNGRIAFPITTFSGQVIGCHHRPLAEKGNWFVTSFEHLKIAMFPLLINDPLTKKLIAAFESQWDALSLLDLLGWPNDEALEIGFVITRGAMNGKIIQRCCLPDAKIVAFGQNDKAGKQWLSRIVKAAQGEVFHVQIPTEHKDLNDWIRAGAKWDDIQTAIQPIKEIVGNTGNEPDSIEANSAYEGVAVQEIAKDGRIYVQLPSAANRLMSEFASDMGRALVEAEIYNRNGVPFTLNHLTQTLKLMSPDSFRTWSEKYAVCFAWVESEDSPTMRVRKSMSVTDATTTLSSEYFLNHLRPIRKLNPVRLPVLRKSGAIELLPIGYDAESQTFTFETPGLDYPKEMSLAEAKAILGDLLAEFCFPDDGGRSMAVVVSGMLTLCAYGLLPNGTLVPCFIILANAEGAGKTLVAKVIVVPILGKFEAGVKPGNDEELRKALLGAVMQGRNCIILDNIKEHLDSASLEAFLTSTVWSDRILGSNKSFSGEKSTVVFATGNACTVSPDMRRRSLFVTLFMREERAEARQFNRSLDVPYLLEKRGDILSAVWTLIKAWDADGRPRGSKTHSSFPEWTKTIAAIVEHAGYRSPVETPLVDVDADRDGSDMRKMVNALPLGTPMTMYEFKELVAFARQTGAFESLLGSEGELDKKVNTAFSRILKRYDRRFIGDYIFMLQGQGHARRYVFKKAELDTPMPPDLQGGGAT